MAIITLDLPAGMYRNGTPYGRRYRWTDGSLVRWHDGSIRPIGGWQRRTSGGVNIASLLADPALEAVRDIYAWKDLSLNANTVFGTNLGLYHMSNGNVITDITYAGYTPVNPSKDADAEGGYGDGPYGVGAYGVEGNLDATPIVPPDRWYFANFGEILLTGVRNNGDMHELDLGTLTLSVVTNAPSPVQDVVVTDERQVFAIGCNGEPRRIQASDSENRNDWTPVISNQAIDRTLPGNGKLLRCVKVLRHILILGENDAYAARYIRPPYVYGIELVGTNCGPICAEAVQNTDRFAVWWGARNFWVYDGSIQVLPCEVVDFLYEDIDPLQISKISGFTVSDFSEIWWLYQSQTTTTTEVDSYVVWNYRDNTWVTGRIDRTAGIDRGVLLFPVYVSSDGFIYNHEQDGQIPDGDVYAITGAIDIADGDNSVAVKAIYPDTQASGDVTFEILAKDFPNATEYTYGPYAYANPVMTRARGRSIRLKVNFQLSSSELGICRLDVARLGGGRR